MTGSRPSAGSGWRQGGTPGPPFWRSAKLSSFLGASFLAFKFQPLRPAPPWGPSEQSILGKRRDPTVGSRSRDSLQKAGGLWISAFTSPAGGARWSWGGRLGQQVTVDLKSKQRPVRESSAPANPAVCSRPPLALYRLKETILPSATEASPSSEVWEVAICGGGERLRGEVPEQSKGSVCPSGQLWAWKHRFRCPKQALGTMPRHLRLLGPWRLALSPSRAQGVSCSLPAAPRNQLAWEVLLFCGLMLSSSLPGPLQPKSWGREEKDVRTGAMAA